MANAEIVPVGFDELELVEDLYNEVYRPPQDLAYLQRRLKGRLAPLILIAQVERRPVGFAIGYENKPGTFYCWLIGVLQDYRRSGIASQLMEAMAAWARDNEFHTVRFECYNRHRPMLRLAIHQGYDIVGMRHDNDTGDNLLIMELNLAEDEGEE